jgi:hypothetical protein
MRAFAEAPFREVERLFRGRDGLLALAGIDGQMAAALEHEKAVARWWIRARLERRRDRVELAAHLVRAAAGLAQQIRGGEHAALALMRIGIADRRDQQLPKLLGAPLLAAGDSRLPQRQCRAGSDRERHGRGAGHQEPITPHELPAAICHGVGPRKHGPMAGVALEIVGQRAYRGVTLVRILLQRLEHDGIEIAPQLFGERAGHSRARPGRLDTEDRLLELTARRATEHVRPSAAQQLVKHHPERVDIRRYGDRLICDLLGRGIVRRKRELRELRARGVRVGPSRAAHRPRAAARAARARSRRSPSASLGRRSSRNAGGRTS